MHHATLSNARRHPGPGTRRNGCLAEIWGRTGAQTPAPLQPGDVVRMEVEGIGVIENHIVDGVRLPDVAPARQRPRPDRAGH